MKYMIYVGKKNVLFYTIVHRFFKKNIEVSVDMFFKVCYSMFLKVHKRKSTATGLSHALSKYLLPFKLQYVFFL